MIFWILFALFLVGLFDLAVLGPLDRMTGVTRDENRWWKL